MFEDSNLQTPIVHVFDVMYFALTSTNPVTRINRVRDANYTRLKIEITRQDLHRDCLKSLGDFRYRMRHVLTQIWRFVVSTCRIYKC